MEIASAEVLSVESIVKPTNQMDQLTELQLALIGGGIGEVVVG